MTKKSDAPAIRFKGFSDAWEQRKAIDIADYSKGNGYSKGDLTDAGTPIILYGRLYTKYQFAISEVDTFAVPRNSAVYSQGNEVIVPASGETAEDIARASAVEKSGVLLGGDLNILRPFDFINPLFLALAISNGEPQKELAKKAQGKSVVHIHNTDIQEVTIAYPSRTEQDRIVSVFRQLDNLITLHQRKFEKLTNVKKSMLEKMFPQNGSSYPEIRFKGFTDPWEQRKAKEICSIGTGKSNTQDQVDDGKYPFYIRSDVPVRSNKYLYDCEAVITIGDGNIGKVFHYVNGKFDLHQRCYKMTDFKDIWGKYFFYYFSTKFYDRAMKMTAKATVDSVRLEMISEMDIKKPPQISEQKQIAEFFANLDNLITLHQRQSFSHSTPDISLSVQLIHPFYTSSWEQRKLGDIGKARSGVGFPDADQGGVTGVPFFKVSDMNLDGNENEMIVANNYVTTEQIAEHRWSPITELPAIFFAKVGAAVMLNRKRLCRFPFLLDNNTMAYSLSPTKWDADFAKALFGTVDLTSLVQVGALPSYNAGDVESMGIYLPSLFEQEQIGAFFKLLDNLITLHQRKGKAAVSGCSNDANNSKGVCCKARDFGYKCHKKDESK